MFTIIKNIKLLKLNNINKRWKHVERKVKVKDLDINIVESGNGKENILLMPGALGTSWTDFKPQIENLPKLLPNSCIIAWDPPGYGKSIPPQRIFDLDFFHNDAYYAVELMKLLNKPHFSILGWSDGGITGIIAAARYADNVEKLVIWGANAYVTEGELKVLENIKDVNKWSPRMREPMVEIYGAERFAMLWAEWVDAMAAIYKQKNGDICKVDVEQIKAPTLLVHGRKDPMIAAEHVPYLKKHIKNVKYHEFPEGKHNIHLRYAEEFNKLVSEFLLEKC